MPVKGLIFDMDGTLIDTEKISVEAWFAAGRKYDIPVDNDFILSIMGTPKAEIKQIYHKTFETDIAFDDFYNARVDYIMRYREEHPIPIKPGTTEILTFAAENNIPCAIATSTSSASAHKNLNSTGLYKYFKAVICGDMIENGKPAPDIFEKAAKAIGFSAGECAVIEDSRNGIIGARASGALTFLVPDIVIPDEDMKKSADYITDSLNDVAKILRTLI